MNDLIVFKGRLGMYSSAALRRMAASTKDVGRLLVLNATLLMRMA